MRRKLQTVMICLILFFISISFVPTIHSIDVYGEARDAFYFRVLSENSTGDDEFQRYFDGTYLHVARGNSGMFAYHLNSSGTLDFITSIDDGGKYLGCFGYANITGDEDVISIYTIDDLYAIRNDLDGDYALARSLNFQTNSHYVDYEVSKSENTTGDGWLPIGDDSNPFTGTFDGQGYSISNMRIIRGTDAGLFGHIDGATIQNVGIGAAYMYHYPVFEGEDIGSLIGECYDSHVLRCYSANSVVTGEQAVGNLIGEVYGDSVIEECYAIRNTGDAIVFCEHLGGGLIGYLGYSTVKNCYASGFTTKRVSGFYDTAGGLIGVSSHSTIENCFSTGEVEYQYNPQPTDAGLLGDTSSIVSDTGNFFDNESSKQLTSAGNAVGRNSSDMNDYDTFNDAGWDIASIGDWNGEVWYIDDGNDYPRLYYQHDDYEWEPSYIYAGRQDSGLSAYSFNGTAYTLIDTITGGGEYRYGCAIDDDFLFVAGYNGCSAYTFNGTNLTLVDEETTGQWSKEISVEKIGSDYYVYSTNELPLTIGLRASVFNGTAFQTHEAVYNVGAGSGVYAINGHVYYITWEDYLYALEYDGDTNLTLLDTFENTSGYGAGCCWATDGYHDDYEYVFYGDYFGGSNYVLNCVLWDGTNFVELLDRINATIGGYVEGHILGYGDFSYPSSGLLFCGGYSTNVISGYGTLFSSDYITVAQGMYDAWYDYNNTVPDFENAMNNIQDGGTIVIWNGTYPSWGFTKYQPYPGTNPIINIANLTIIGNDSYYTYIEDDIVISAQNVIIRGIRALSLSSSYNYTTLDNCEFGYDDATYDIEFSGVYDGFINNTVVTGWADNGIYLSGCSFCNVSNCVMYSSEKAWNTEYILSSSSNNITIYNNYLFETGTTGIKLSSSPDVRIMSNVIKGGQYHLYGNGLNIYDSDNIFVYNNEIFNYTTSDSSDARYDDAILLDESPSNITIINNFFHDCGHSGVYCYEGCNILNVSNNYFWNLSTGYKEKYSDKYDFVLNNNTMYDIIFTGMQFCAVHGLNISSNRLTNVPEGILLIGSTTDVMIYDNDVSFCNYAIYLGVDSENNVFSNMIYNNTYGIQLVVSSDNTIVSNLVWNNTYGIYVPEHSDDNTIYNNYFDNTNNAIDSGSGNVWNITKTLGTNIIGGAYLCGNYWSDYTGRDLDGDEIGDTELPYVIPEDGGGGGEE